jgi:hypothetical protein
MFWCLARPAPYCFQNSPGYFSLFVFLGNL